MKIQPDQSDLPLGTVNQDVYGEIRDYLQTGNDVNIQFIIIVSSCLGHSEWFLNLLAYFICTKLNTLTFCTSPNSMLLKKGKFATAEGSLNVISTRVIEKQND